jgi:hypothetical protein
MHCAHALYPLYKQAFSHVYACTLPELGRLFLAQYMYERM